ncbi:MAG: hypothetical protein ACE5HE_13310 [Phycisphaerae bacterium]
MKRNGRLQRDVFALLRRRIIRETELALLIGLHYPERMPRIPTIEVGRGEFHPAFAARFWRQVLDIDDHRNGAYDDAPRPRDWHLRFGSRRLG